MQFNYHVIVYTGYGSEYVAGPCHVVRIIMLIAIVSSISTGCNKIFVQFFYYALLHTSTPKQFLAHDKLQKVAELFDSVDIFNISHSAPKSEITKKKKEIFYESNNDRSTKSRILSVGEERSTFHLISSIVSSRRWLLYLYVD